MLGAAGEHAIGFRRAAGDEVVHQHTYIGFIAARGPGLLLLHLPRGIDAGEQALGRRFFVTGGAVDLAGEVQAAYVLGLQAST